MKIFKMKNCPHCEQVNYDLANKFGVEVIDIHDADYSGFVPESVPVFQTQGMTLMGPNQINSLFNVISNVTKKTKE